jgi:transcriptional regulator with XRE-family HTH domain
MHLYTPEEVLKLVKTITNDNYDNDLANRLGVRKQSLSQYKNKKSVDVQLRIITLLLNIIENKND